MFPLKDNIPLSRFPIVTVVLITINVIVYLLEIRHGGSFFGGPTDGVAVHYGAIPYELTHPGDHCQLVTKLSPHGPLATVACQGQPGVRVTPGPQPATPVTVFTSMFLHASFLHIFGNMIFLAMFGPSVEDAMGRVRFIAFYLLGGLIALGDQAVRQECATPSRRAAAVAAGVLGRCPGA